MKPFLIPIILVIIGGIMLILPIGDIGNQLFPCIQDPQNSFPCQNTYELYGRGIAFLLISMAIIIGVIQGLRGYYWGK